MDEDVIRELQEKGYQIKRNGISNYTLNKKSRIVFVGPIPDHTDDTKSTKDIPSWKRMCYCILKNDHICRFMGFGMTRQQQKRLDAIQKHRGNLIMKYKSPVYNVIAVPIEKVRPNNYNPNKVAPPEMRLLYESIKEDGYTMPVVCYYAKAQDVYLIVDGFHRYRVMLDHPDIYEREQGMLPVSVIEKPIDKRMASTQANHRPCRAVSRYKVWRGMAPCGGIR